MKDIRYLVIHSPGPKWLAEKSFFEQPGLDLHIAHYRKLLDAGNLMAGGPSLFQFRFDPERSLRRVR